MVLCKTLRIGRIPTTGFVFSADKYADAKPFTTTLHISYPARPGATVSLVKAGDTLDACIQDAVLDSAGNASVQYTVSKKQTLYTMVKEGDCCTTFSYPPCLVSNYISFDVAPAGSISFSSVPGGAEIFLDGQDQGAITPNTVSGIPVGTHAYTLKLVGYNDYTGSIDIALNQTVSVTATLIAACTPVWKCEFPLTGYETDGCGNRRANSVCNPPEIGSISFTSTPPGAEIHIDGADQNIKTPATISNIPVGSHTYTLKQTGYIDVTGTVEVGLNQTAVASATLTPVARPGIGAGTIIALGLVVAVALGAVVYASGKKKPEYTLPGYRSR